MKLIDNFVTYISLDIILWYLITSRFYSQVGLRHSYSPKTKTKELNRNVYRAHQLLNLHANEVFSSVVLASLALGISMITTPIFGTIRFHDSLSNFIIAFGIVLVLLVGLNILPFLISLVLKITKTSFANHTTPS